MAIGRVNARQAMNSHHYLSGAVECILPDGFAHVSGRQHEVTGDDEHRLVGAANDFLNQEKNQHESEEFGDFFPRRQRVNTTSSAQINRRKEQQHGDVLQGPSNEDAAT